MLDWLKNNVSVAVTVVILAGGGIINAVKVSASVGDLKTRIAIIEREGTETTRNLERKVAGLENQNNELALQMKETKEVLNKIDRRVGYLLCRQDKRFCVE